MYVVCIVAWVLDRTSPKPPQTHHHSPTYQSKNWRTAGMAMYGYFKPLPGALQLLLDRKNIPGTTRNESPPCLAAGAWTSGNFHLLDMSWRSGNVHLFQPLLPSCHDLACLVAAFRPVGLQKLKLITLQCQDGPLRPSRWPSNPSAVPWPQTWNEPVISPAHLAPGCDSLWSAEEQLDWSWLKLFETTGGYHG